MLETCQFINLNSDVFSCHKQIKQSLSPEVKAMVDSGLVRIEITGFSPGSVVVNFTIFAPSANQSHINVSSAVLHSLKNSTKYTVDLNITSIKGMVCVICVMKSGLVVNK